MFILSIVPVVEGVIASAAPVRLVVVELATVLRASGRFPVTVEVVKAIVKFAPVAPPVRVPTLVRLELTTPLASVVPVSEPASDDGEVQDVAVVPSVVRTCPFVPIDVGSLRE
jgi:hypothetical protein